MPHISELTDADALNAARMTGLPFDSVRRTDWGIVVMCDNMPMSFCFHFKRDSFECGIPGLLTPRVDMVVDFLRERGYYLTPRPPLQRSGGSRISLSFGEGRGEADNR